jgi:hypothetical protein
LPKAAEPSVSSLDDPTMATETVMALDALAGDAILEWVSS